MRFIYRRVERTRPKPRRKVLGFIGVAAAVAFIPNIAMAANSAGPPAHNNFDKNTNGWYGELQVVKNGHDNPYGSGYADGIRASKGSGYASVGTDGAYTFWKAGVGCCPSADQAGTLPASGYTTSIDVYLDVAWATDHPDVRFDWDSALTESRSYLTAHPDDDGFLTDLIFNGSTTPADYPGGPGFVVQASQNSQPGSAYAENPCSPLVAQAGDGCTPPS